ncbi:MAG: hypothetical protein GY760_28185 [Deltaproteobacteria bacterium]|nr:hypothetical protein [Deltaproteobacteria bacterium]
MRKLIFIFGFIIITGCTPKNKVVTINQFIPKVGVYEITFKAVYGPKKNNTAKGILKLFKVKWSMRSDRRFLYGSVDDIDFDIVAAPICDVDPASQDPLNPGVVVTKSGSNIIIGSSGNKWTPGQTISDGCGIVLSIQKFKNNDFMGYWEPYGIIAGGTGEYEAKFIREH